MGFQNAATAGELGVHAARLYSVMSPPRTGRCSPKSAGRVPYADDQLSRPPVLLSALASISLAFAPLITHVTVSEEAAAPWPQVSVNTPSPIAGNCFNAGTDAAVWREDNNRLLDAWVRRNCRQPSSRLHGQIAELQAANRQLRADKAELTECVDVYAQGIRELAAELDRYRRDDASLPDNVRHLPNLR